jgi:hypothetical protein
VFHNPRLVFTNFGAMVQGKMTMRLRKSEALFLEVAIGVLR